jgi:hypothetical protein
MTTWKPPHVKSITAPLKNSSNSHDSQQLASEEPPQPMVNSWALWMSSGLKPEDLCLLCLLVMLSFRMFQVCVSCLKGRSLHLGILWQSSRPCRQKTLRFVWLKGYLLCTKDYYQVPASRSLLGTKINGPRKSQTLSELNIEAKITSTGNHLKQKMICYVNPCFKVGAKFHGSLVV